MAISGLYFSHILFWGCSFVYISALLFDWNVHSEIGDVTLMCVVGLQEKLIKDKTRLSISSNASSFNSNQAKISLTAPRRASRITEDTGELLHCLKTLIRSCTDLDPGSQLRHY